MDSHERNLFSEFERQPYVDLTEWRLQLVAYTDAQLGSAEQELRQHLGDSLSAATHESVLNAALSHRLRALLEQIEPTVRVGDLIHVKGNIVYDIFTASGHDFEADWLGQGSELHGRFESVAVRDYLDESILDASVDQLSEDFVATRIRRFGAHLVLADPVEVRPDGTVQFIPDCESLFIPLMYRRLSLAGYLSWET